MTDLETGDVCVQSDTMALKGPNVFFSETHSEKGFACEERCEKFASLAIS